MTCENKKTRGPKELIPVVGDPTLPSIQGFSPEYRDFLRKINMRTKAFSSPDPEDYFGVDYCGC